MKSLTADQIRAKISGIDATTRALVLRARACEIWIAELEQATRAELEWRGSELGDPRNELPVLVNLAVSPIGVALPAAKSFHAVLIASPGFDAAKTQLDGLEAALAVAEDRERTEARKVALAEADRAERREAAIQKAIAETEALFV
jgi:hypothetical protein